MTTELGLIHSGAHQKIICLPPGLLLKMIRQAFSHCLDVSDADNVSMWKNIGNETSYQFSEFNLQESITYYVSVRATDLTGNVSAVASSNGFLVDTTAPTISAVSVHGTTTISFDNLS